MADKEFERDDPMELVGLTFPIESGLENDRAAARTFIEEFALMGWSGSKIRALFESSEYQACFDIRSRRGAGFVDGLIADVFEVKTNG